MKTPLCVIAPCLLIVNGLQLLADSGTASGLADLTTAQWRDDLRYFATELSKRHKNAFHHTPKEQFEKAVAELDAALPSLRADGIVVGLLRITARVGDGHTYVRLPKDFPRYPLSLYWFGDELRVIRTTPAYARALGAKVVRVGRADVRQAAQVVQEIISQHESEWLVRSMGPQLLAYPGVLRGLGLLGEHPPYTFEDAAGAQFSLKLEPVAADATLEWLSPAKAVPLYQQKPDVQFWSTYLPERRTVYACFRGYDTLVRSCRDLFALIDSVRADRLVIDMRQNGGGDFTRVRWLLFPGLKERPALTAPGHLYILVGRRTFSAAMVNAIDFRNKWKAVLVGEPIGERPNSYQESRRFVLPNSKLTVSYSCGYYQWQEKDTPAVYPDRHIDLSWADYRAGRDPVLEWVLSQAAPK